MGSESRVCAWSTSLLPTAALRNISRSACIENRPSLRLLPFQSPKFSGNPWDTGPK